MSPVYSGDLICGWCDSKHEHENKIVREKKITTSNGRLNVSRGHVDLDTGHEYLEPGKLMRYLIGT